MKSKLIISIILIITIFLAIGLGLFLGIASRLELLNIFFSLTPVTPLISETNILVLGVDDAFGHRSDTIMVLHVNPEKKEAALLSIPRDTLVVVPNRGLDKINHAYAYGGIDLSRRTIENFLNINIPYYILVDLAGIENIIDKIGGVTVNVEKRMYYVDYAGNLYIDLKPGLQKLNGKQAMGYLRFRHTDNDFARIGRQQRFLQSLANELMKKENLFKTPELFISLLSCVESNLNSRQILGLSLALRACHELGQIKMLTVPGMDFMVDGIYYWRPDESEIAKIINQFFLAKKENISG